MIYLLSLFTIFGFITSTELTEAPTSIHSSASSLFNLKEEKKDNQCKPVLCMMHCADGWDIDENGCEICKCKRIQPLCELEKCEMFCEFGKKKDVHGCDLCQCNEEPVINLEKCPKLLCEEKCENGYAKDENDCQTCKCNKPTDLLPKSDPSSLPVVCSPVRCRMYCPFGWEKNDFGCEVCACSGKPVKTKRPVISPAVTKSCPLNECSSTCENGFIKDENDCNTCECKELVLPEAAKVEEEELTTVCKPVRCKMFCEFGWAKNELGCDICKCSTNKSISNLQTNFQPKKKKFLFSNQQRCRWDYCNNYCNFGYTYDKVGCKKCIIYDLKFDSNTCRVCECKSSPTNFFLNNPFFF